MRESTKAAIDSTALARVMGEKTLEGMIGLKENGLLGMPSC